MIARRLLPSLVLAGVLCTCAEPAAGPGGPGMASIAVQAMAPPSLSVFAPTLFVEQIRATLSRPTNSDIRQVLDTRTVPFGLNTSSVSMSLSALVVGSEQLDLELEYLTAAGVTLFVSSQQVQVVAGGRVSAPPTPPFYIGPGSNVAFLALTPLDSILSLGDSLGYDVTAFDGNQQLVPDFYITWSVSDPRVSISPLGVVSAPDITQLITVTARTPNQVSATTSLVLLGSAALGISPDSVEKLPGGTQQFTVTVGATRGATIVWSVAGIDGGNAVVGTIDSTGFYTAPTTVPSPNVLQVCAREQAMPARNGCATVVVT